MNLEAVLKRYDHERLTIVTIASHTALQILRGAKKAGFNTLALARRGTEWFYGRFSFIDEVWPIEFPDLPRYAERLVERNAVLVPHGSYVEYVGPRNAVEMPLPTFGNRYLVEWESDQRLKMSLLREAGIPTPRTFEDPRDVDGPVIVKMYGAKGGRGYFIARDREELMGRLRAVGGPYIIQEYVLGVPAYYHFFASPMYSRVELFGMDIRYESNVDGRTLGLAEPTFVVVGNIPLVLRESLLPTVQRYGESFAAVVAERVPPGMVGPYSLESIVRDTLEIAVFEFSGRIVAGTNTYMGVGSPYSTLYFERPMDMGERIGLEVAEAARRGRLDSVLT